MTLFTLTMTFIIIPPLTSLHYPPSNLHLHLHDICFVNVFDSFIPAIMLNMPRFKSSVLFGIHTLLEKSLQH